MGRSRTEGLAVSGFNVSTIAIVVIVSAMWLATVADRLLHLGWGWGRQILSIAPIIVVGSMLVRVIGHGIFRWVGAAPRRTQ